MNYETTYIINADDGSRISVCLNKIIAVNLKAENILVVSFDYGAEVEIPFMETSAADLAFEDLVDSWSKYCYRHMADIIR